MIEARTSIEINAPIAEVWRVMLDLPAYRDWNPFIVDAVGAGRTLKVGDEFKLHVVWSDGKKVTSGEHVTRVDAPHEVDGASRAVLGYRFDGFLHALNLVRALRLQSLEQKPGGPTHYTSVENMTGMIARYVPIALVQDGFERHARALKQYVEKPR